MTDITQYFKGEFLVSPTILLQKLQQVKAFVFDWDGVFNGGTKDEDGSSQFSEIDSMGTNLMRFNHFLRNNVAPVTAIITGEKNKGAFAFAKREHFHAVYAGIKYKPDAVKHLCKEHHLKPEEICFFFDDAIDLSSAAVCGLRIMAYRDCNPLLLQYAKKHQMADYITRADGAHYAVREATEMLMGLSGQYEESVQARMDFNDLYKRFLKARNKPEPVLYGEDDGKIVEMKTL